ncbi:MAG TPA: hypothetical protein VHV30_11865 [Polyangiaceae bacterium]|jgi:hypothetical protein|nr:hypothetical protein [Polyangiaceae bacterium]
MSDEFKIRVHGGKPDLQAIAAALRSKGLVVLAEGEGYVNLAYAGQEEAARAWGGHVVVETQPAGVSVVLNAARRPREVVSDIVSELQKQRLAAELLED